MLVAEFEKFHAAALTRRQKVPTLRELFVTLAVTLIMAPFAFVTFMVIPVMGQVTVGFSVALTLLYIVYRRSLLVALATIGGSLVFWCALFGTIQVIKNNLEVPLFFFTATGIPVCAMYSIFIGTRIWTIRGGADW